MTENEIRLAEESMLAIEGHETIFDSVFQALVAQLGYKYQPGDEGQSNSEYCKLRSRRLNFVFQMVTSSTV
jgi:hypothetical protein